MKKNKFNFLIAAACFSATAFAQNFTWMKGSTSSSVAGTYGTQGTAAAANNPGGRHGCATWTDAQGSLWLFGGEGYTTNTNICWLNDLWKYNPSTNDWTWIRGSNTPNATAMYGTQGVAAPTNEPGAREFSVTWTDASGNFWLFGGDGISSTPSASANRLADLWKYNPTTNEWTWMSGSNGINANGVYGTQNVAAPSNMPGARYGSATWVDNTGKLWLFGGRGFAISGGSTFLNDLWNFNPATNQWTWVSGSSAGGIIPGVYGTLQTPAAGNLPGSREFPCFWTNSAGDLVLFGGRGYASTTSPGYLNDMWLYNASTGNWTWMNGSNTVNQAGLYGTLGVPSNTNVPGGRLSSASWKDGMGKYWVFGGLGWSATNVNALNDIWRYDPVTNEWTWMKGAQTINQNGTYGTQGVTSPASVPGAREYNTWWKAPLNGELWLFGGLGMDASSVSSDQMNDLWKFKPPCNPDSVTVSSTSVCSGGAISFTAFTTYPATISWYNQTSPNAIGTGSVYSGFAPIAQTSTVYPYFAQANSCTATPMVMIPLAIEPLPLISVIGTTAVCLGQSTTLTATGANTFLWSTGTQGSSITATPGAQNFTCTVTGTSSANCQSTAGFTVAALPLPNVGATSSKTMMCRFETAVLTATGASTYSWSTSQTTATINVNPLITTGYTVTGTDANGCSSSYTIMQFVSICTGMDKNNNTLTTGVYPNPNQNRFNIMVEQEAILMIINQLGQKVFEQKLAPGHTNVTTELKPGVYLYQVAGPENKTVSGKLLIE